MEFRDLERRRELEVASEDTPLEGEGDSGGLGEEDSCEGCGLVPSRVYGYGVISRRVASPRRDGWRGRAASHPTRRQDPQPPPHVPP